MVGPRKPLPDTPVVPLVPQRGAVSGGPISDPRFHLVESADEPMTCSWFVFRAGAGADTDQINDTDPVDRTDPVDEDVPAPALAALVAS